VLLDLLGQPGQADRLIVGEYALAPGLQIQLHPQIRPARTTDNLVRLVPDPRF